MLLRRFYTMVSHQQGFCVIFQGDEVEDVKKNDIDEKATRFNWRRSPETRAEDEKVRYCM